MPPGSPFRRGTSLNPFRWVTGLLKLLLVSELLAILMTFKNVNRSKESFVQSPSLSRRQARTGLSALETTIPCLTKDQLLLDNQ